MSLGIGGVEVKKVEEEVEIDVEDEKEPREGEMRRINIWYKPDISPSSYLHEHEATKSLSHC